MQPTRIATEIQRAKKNKNDHAIYLDLLIDPVLPDKSFKAVVEKLLVRKSLGDALRNEGLALAPPNPANAPAHASAGRQGLTYEIYKLWEDKAYVGTVEVAPIKTVLSARESYVRVAVKFKLQGEKASIHQSAAFLGYAIK